MDSTQIPNETRFLLLTIIDNDGDIDDLKKNGYSYFQITSFIKNEIQLGNAHFSNNILTLTEKGLQIKNELVEKLDYQNSNKVVAPKLSGIIKTKIRDDSIFIPSENELDF